ncbi:TRAP transporter small permease [Rubrobacter taiwanensis]|jgi:TRAP-type C4-dicarboxylate transport system permease small subunit|nr:TRAP transporter small permease [Rubrobacter taiwanensis]
MMLLTVADVVGRWLLNMPIQGTIELTQLAMVVIVYFTLARVEYYDEHITIRFVSDRLPWRWQYVVRIVAGVVSFVLLLLLTWQLYEFALRMRAVGLTSDLLQIPIYLVVFLAVAGAGVYALAVLNNILSFVRSTIPERSE